MKDYCEECKFFKFGDADGFGWCSLWEESDVNMKDEACVEFEEKKKLTMSEYEFKKKMDDLFSEIRLLRLEVMKLRSSMKDEALTGQFLNMRDACAYLHISRATMQKRLLDGEIGFAVKKGKGWLFPADKLKLYASGF